MFRGSKNMFWAVNAFLILCYVMLIVSIRGTGGEVLIERYISIRMLLALGIGFIFMYTVSIYFAIKRTEARWAQYLFYIAMLTAISSVVILGYFTHGESIRSILLNDKNDAMMDFFNSITYGMKPYVNKVNGRI